MACQPLILHVNSSFRQNTSESASDFTMPFQIQPHRANFKRMILRDLVVPQTFYNIRSGYNVFEYQDAGGVKQFTLTPGNYDLDTFKAQVLSLSTTAGRALTVTDSFNLKLTFTAGAGVVIRWSLMPVLASLCGFEATNTASATTHTGIQAYDLSPDKFLFLSISGLESCYMPGRSIQCTTPIALYSNGAVISKSESPIEIPIDDSFLRNSQIRITLTHADGRLVDLNGLNWGFTANLQ